MLNVEAEEPVVPYHTRGLLPTGITIVAASKATSDEFVGVTTRRQKQNDHDSNGVKIVANTATDVKPDATPRTDCETRVAI